MRTRDVGGVAMKEYDHGLGLVARPEASDVKLVASGIEDEFGASFDISHIKAVEEDVFALRIFGSRGHPALECLAT